MARREEPAYRSARERADKHTSGFESTTVAVPEGMKRFKLKSAGTKTIDILPFRVGKGNPFAKEGEVHYERTFHVHKSLGPNEDSYVCPAKTSGEKCPVCEYRAKLARNPDADEDLVKSLRPSERQLFLVIDHADREAGPQLWDVSYHLFGKVLDSVLKNSDEDDGFDLFYHLTKGLSLKLMVVEKSMGKGKPFALVESVLFKQRKEQYSADMLDELPCLDDLLVIKPYKELQAILMHTEADEASDEDAPPPKKAKKALPADDDSDEDDEDAPPPKKAKKAAPADDDDDDDDDDDSPPPPAKKSKTPPPDDDDDDADDTPPAKSSKKAAPADDDDDDDAPPPTKKGKPAPAADSWDDDDDDSPPPAKAKKTPPPADDDDDDDTPPPPKKSKKAAPPADDDDDDDAPPPPAKKSKTPPPDDDDDDDAPPPAKKGKGKSPKDDDWDDDE